MTRDQEIRDQLERQWVKKESPFCEHSRFSDICARCLLSDSETLHKLMISATNYGGSLDGILREAQQMLDWAGPLSDKELLEFLNT